MRTRLHPVVTWMLAFVLGACAVGGADTPSGTTPLSPSTSPPAGSTSPSASPSSAISPVHAAQQVIDAALATMAEVTFRYEVEVRSADSDDTRKPVTGQGQVSFGDPVQFRFAADAASALGSSSDVIFDGEHAFFPAGDALPPDTWLVVDLAPPLATVVRDSMLRRFGASALVLVAPLGATEARLAGQETVRGIATSRFVANVDISRSREHVPDVGLPAYESQVAAFAANRTPLTHELEVWVDPEGRIVRTRYEESVSSTTTILVTYDFMDFGAPMQAAPPEGAEVLTIREAQERYRQVVESPSPSP